MAWEPRDNSGTLHKRSEEERKSERSSEYSGSVMIEGREFWVDAWVKTAQQSGKKFFSLSFKPKDGAQRSSAPPQRDYGRPLNDGGRYPPNGGGQAPSYKRAPDDEVPF
jgi:hypothetical protein